MVLLAHLVAPRRRGTAAVETRGKDRGRREKRLRHTLNVEHNL